MKKRFLTTTIALVLCLCFSMEVFAEEGYTPGTDKIIVDKVNNTITFIYDSTNESLMNQWESLPSFNDVSNDAWYQMYVSHLAQLGIIDTTSNANFFPETPITKAEFVEMVALVANSDLTVQNENNIIGTESQHIDAVQWAVTNNIIPQNSSTFHPNDYISLEEAAEILYGLAEYDNNATIEQLDAMNTNSSTPQFETGPLQFASKLLSGTNTELLPSDTLKKCEAAKMLSFYIVLNDRPTFITGTTPIEYIHVEENNSNEQIMTEESISENNESFHAERAEADTTTSEDFVINWTSRGDVNTSVHKQITHRGFLILFNDKSNSISNITGKFSPTARRYVYDGCVAPDRTDDLGETERFSAGHYCDIYLRNKFLQDDLTAYTKFNNHYYDAKMYYSWGDWQPAYDELGRSMHFMEDTLSPPHSALITGNKHEEYENWVHNNMRDDYFTTHADSSTYSFMSTSHFCDISRNFATYSSGLADGCIKGSDSVKISYTRACLTKCQRAVAGLAYRYLIDTGRNS